MRRPAVPRFGRQVKPLKKVIDNSAAVPNSKVEKETPVRKKKETFVCLFVILYFYPAAPTGSDGFSKYTV